MAKGRAFAKPLPAKRTEFNGVVYDSKAEAARAQVLAERLAAGQIAAVFRQVKCDVGEPGVDMPYRVDFLVFERDAVGDYTVHAEDVKGADSPTFRRHVKQWKKRGAVPLQTIRRGKPECWICGGREFPPATHDDKRTVSGVTYRSLPIADHALHLAAARDVPSVVEAWWRDVEVDHGGKPVGTADFLVIENRSEFRVPHFVAFLPASHPIDAPPDWWRPEMFPVRTFRVHRGKVESFVIHGDGTAS